MTEQLHQSFSSRFIMHMPITRGVGHLLTALPAHSGARAVSSRDQLTTGQCPVEWSVNSVVCDQQCTALVKVNGFAVSCE